MAVYHISSKGEPEICRARVQCRLGGDQNHYTSPEKARQAFELSQKGEMFKIIAKTSPDTRSDDSMNAAKPKVQIVKNPSLPKLKSSNSSSTQNKPDQKYFTGTHDVKDVPFIVENGLGKNLPIFAAYSLHAGRMNPSNGDGDDYDQYGNGTAIIMSEKDGKRPRVVTSAGYTLEEMAKSLGRPVIQYKQQLNGNDTETSGLYIVGVTDGQGKSYGWIPNKKIHYFVFK